MSRMRQIQRKSQVSSGRRPSAQMEVLEGRLLMAVNSWKSAVSGNWTDATKWSLGHVPDQTEDVNINIAGNYTVTVPNQGSAFVSAKSVNIGNATGVQQLNLNGRAIIYGNFSLQAGDKININAGGFFDARVPELTTTTLNGSIVLNGTTSAYSRLFVGSANFTGTGEIVFNTGGSGYYVNYIEGGRYTLGSGNTLRGKTGGVYGLLTNNGKIKIEGTTADFWYISAGITNNGTFDALSGARVRSYNIKNNAGKTINISGSTSFELEGAWSNLGTINVTNSNFNLGGDFSSIGTINRTNSVFNFTGRYDLKGGSLALTAKTGSWIWKGGKLANGSFDSKQLYTLVPDTAPGAYGQFENVTLTNDFSIPAGYYLNVYNSMTIDAGKKLLLNGTSTARSAVFTYGAINGGGEIVFNTSANNVLSGNGWSLGANLVIHGKTGRIGGGFTNNGTVQADTANESITFDDVINNGNLIAAPGQFKIQRFTQNASGTMTVGIGGTSAGSNMGKFNFQEITYATTLGGTLNAVLMNNYAPAAGTNFAIASFAKAPVGVFAKTNLDAGNGRGFDLTQTTTALTLKSKSIASPFASRDSLGNVVVNGTSGIDNINLKTQQGVLYATLNGVTSVFLDRQIISAVANGQANNDTIVATGLRAWKLVGGDGNDSLTGGAANDSLEGGAGNDSLVGNAGSDVLNGGEGNDTAIGNTGDDTYVFGNATALQTDVVVEKSNEGADTLDFSTATAAITIKLNSDTLATQTNRTVKTQTAGQYAFFENAKGGSGADNILGNSAINKLYGGSGNDSIDGSSGNDFLYGDNGNDRLTGGSGTDQLFGGNDNDTFYAQDNEKDSLDGGAGTDIIGSRDNSATVVDTLVSVP